MNQILTILWDSYKLLTAKKLFWISLGLSTIIALLYASVGFTPDGISLLFGAYSFENELLNESSGSAEFFYMTIFTNYLVPWWLGWFALILALISVCPVFPDFLTSGSIDVAISKPISRVTLFLVKYLGCLFFVAIQVFVFCLIVFLAQGLRVDSWNPEVFLAVPLLVFVFSLIFCVAVLVAVKTRSTIFSLLIALLMWGLTLILQWAESATYSMANYDPSSSKIEMEGNLPLDSMTDPIVKVHKVIKYIGAPFPKTREATLMIKRKLAVEDPDKAEDKFTKAKSTHQNRHSDFYIIGTSLAFEALILGLACFIFVRKDY